MLESIFRMLDDEVREKFDGDYGKAAYAEAITAALMAGAYMILHKKVPKEYHTALNATWYGSWLPTHPAHSVRMAAQGAIGQGAASTYDPDRVRAQQIFKTVGRSVEAKVRTWVQNEETLHEDDWDDKVEWINGKLDEIADHVDRNYSADDH